MLVTASRQFRTLIHCSEKCRDASKSIDVVFVREYIITHGSFINQALSFVDANTQISGNRIGFHRLLGLLD